jgi:hemin uptake protein HemP
LLAGLFYSPTPCSAAPAPTGQRKVDRRRSHPAKKNKKKHAIRLTRNCESLSLAKRNAITQEKTSMQATMTAASLLRSAASDKAASLAPVESAHSAESVSAAVDSSALLQGQKAVAISHNGSVYRLQATKLGKLILTK